MIDDSKGGPVCGEYVVTGALQVVVGKTSNGLPVNVLTYTLLRITWFSTTQQPPTTTQFSPIGRLKKQPYYRAGLWGNYLFMSE